MRVLHCPLTVGGHPAQLCRSEREVGLDSRSLSLVRTYFDYAVDERVDLPHSYPRNQLKVWGVVLRMLRDFDVVHYNFGTYLSHPDVVGHSRWRRLAWPLDGLDVRAAKRAGKVVAVTFQGDDARQGEHCRRNYPVHFAHEVDADYYGPKAEADRRARIGLFDRHADLIYALNPDILDVLPARARFLPYASVDPREWQPVFGNDEPLVPHVVHAPTHRTVKGTRYLLAAIERLQAEGVRFRFTQVEGLPNSAARKVYETADLLVDQLLAGYYGGLAVELMALGKPVISYIRAADMHHLPADMLADMPVINAEPGTIYAVLKEWLTDRKGELAARGRRSRAYVERFHDPRTIALRMKADYAAARGAR